MLLWVMLAVWREVVVRRLVVLVVVVLVLGAGGSGAVLSAPAVAQGTSASELCDTGGTVQFGDVGDSDYAAAYILCMRALGLSQGRSDGGYGPDRELNRGQMASFLIRLWTDHLGGQCPSGVVVPFTDTEGTTHEANIECLFGLGITQGTTATTYSPRDPLKASQISRFLYRTYQKADGDQCAGTESSELVRASECLFSLRVVPSTGEATTAIPVTRAQMGVYVIGLWHNLTDRGLPPTPPQLGAATPTQPGLLSTQRIAYEWVGDVWVMDADGANRKQLPDDGGDGEDPVWSPDGTRIAYIVVTDNYDYQLWVTHADGTNPIRVADNTYNHGEWGWSPDGTRIAYLVQAYGVETLRYDNYQLWVTHADGSGQTKLADHAGDPVWSPDGTKIAYGAYGIGKEGVWVLDSDGANHKQLTDDEDVGDSVWSPDGTKIAYTVGLDESVWVMDSDGANQGQLAYPGFDPVWSPDGTKIAYRVRIFHGDAEDFWFTYDTWVMDSDGTNKKKIAEDASDSMWSPDGTKIAYRTNGNLWVADADGSNQKQLAEDVSDPTWSPDGTKIAYHGYDKGGVWVVDADGANETRLTDGKYPVWSP